VQRIALSFDALSREIRLAYAVGVVLALVTAILGRIAGFDRDRAYYATILIVVASYYVLFAATGGTTSALIVESLVMVVFVALAVGGFRFSVWAIVAGLALHGIFDLVHSRVVMNAGVPASWPGFCMAYDVGLAAVLAAMVIRREPSQHVAT
jgi:hypothetical protein